MVDPLRALLVESEFPMKQSRWLVRRDDIVFAGHERNAASPGPPEQVFIQERSQAQSPGSARDDDAIDVNELVVSPAEPPEVVVLVGRAAAHCQEKPRYRGVYAHHAVIARQAVEESQPRRVHGARALHLGAVQGENGLEVVPCGIPNRDCTHAGPSGLAGRSCSVRRPTQGLSHEGCQFRGSGRCRFLPGRRLRLPCPPRSCSG